jgi:hypothetical protein
MNKYNKLTALNNLKFLSMKKIKMLISMLVISSILCLNQAFTQQILSLNNWKVSNFGSGKSSEINATGITLRQYSPVSYEGLNTEVPALTVVCKWMNPLTYVDMGIRLTLTYQNGANENIEQNIPKGVKTEQKLNFSPKSSAGKKVVKIELQQGQTGMEVRILSVEINSDAGCCDKIQTLNNDFSNLIIEMKKNKELNETSLKKLENLLDAYKNIK